MTKIEQLGATYMVNMSNTTFQSTCPCVGSNDEVIASASEAFKVMEIIEEEEVDR